MPDIITDRRITQEEAGRLMAPLELDLLSLFKVIQEDILTGMENYKGTPEQYIEEILNNLSGVGEVGEMAVLKGKALPVGTRRQRSDGVYIKQSDGSWVKETEKKPREKEKQLTLKTKEIMNKINSLKEGQGNYKIDSMTWVKKGYHEYNKFELWTFSGRVVETFPNSEVLAKKISGEIKGIKFKKPKITNKELKIVDFHESKYKGQDMKWTEEFDSSEILQQDMVAYHYSDSPIKNFAIKETCFFPDPYDYTDIGYQILIPKGTKINWYKSGELRVEITKNMKINQLEKGWSEYEEVK